MHALDYAIIGLYMAAMVGVGLLFARKQERTEEYFVGDRKMGAGHIGFSVVATDVGGGFSIGLGGLGFAMGLSGSWLLFTGLIGAWLSAVLVVPKIKTLGDAKGWLTYPDFLEHRFDGRTRLLAALVSGVGYAGFVGAQILAGAKLTTVAFDVNLTTAVLIMAAVVIAYTALGGLQAVVYTDTIQWIVLLGGLILVALPAAWIEVGGWEAVKAAVPPGHLSFTNVGWPQLLSWMLTIVPIWFVANTLYQRIYATRDVKTAKRAWYLAGLLEWPLMALMGTLLGLFGRVMYPTVESELGLPLLIKNVLPVGVVGIVLAAYFSAIMSTADSCLLASVGNFVNDVYQKYVRPEAEHREVLRVSRLLTLGLGAASVAVALTLPKVLDAILLAYAFMVSGLFAPTLAGLLWKRASAAAAFWSMVVGGSVAVLLSVLPKDVLPESLAFGATQPVVVALPLSALVLVAVSLLSPAGAPAPSSEPSSDLPLED